MSELLFWEYNVSSMIVDDGIDIVASKENKFFYIQVKTSSCQDGIWRFSISRSSFDRYHSGTVYYVFVLRKQMSNQFIIIPSTQLNFYIKSDIISDNSKTISVNITYDDKRKIYLLNNTENITAYKGSFRDIR